MLDNTKKRNIEVVFTPSLFQFRQIKENYIVVIVDILRATTSICTAFHWGVKSIIPVKTIEQARDYKDRGFLVAGERLEETFEFADLGNSALEFMTPKIKDQEIVHSTTNGTVAITVAKEGTPNEILIGAFSNITSLRDYLLTKQENILLLCSGWKNCFCIEDTVFCGALIEKLIEKGDFTIHNDSANCSLELWNAAKDNLIGYMEKASHFHRLRKYKMDDVFEYTFTYDTTKVVPKLFDNKLKDTLKEENN
ncbi:MAG: 2-phosphosulfolactate phosphatase [Bacteroidales bacterium]|jgi:2-phosphosulfolactate phosphatase|nr:2-phosphosulfolactate phosphatase [Bacteroidales bacterium]MDD4703844.1 2-phosphosulfolactate phosphatase [Bacteroidales bacterium]MDX9798193.1 2-phosphosulfolactate phosphatase [Bacteroidales bacterium]